MEEARSSDPSARFVGWKPIDAIRKVPTEAQKPMSLEELQGPLEAGGLLRGRKRGWHNVRSSVEVNANKIGTLCYENDLVSLPEWKPVMVMPKESLGSEPDMKR